MTFHSFFKSIARVFVMVWFVLPTVATAQEASPQKIQRFLSVTGFDVAIASIQQGAMAGPALTGEDPEVFGRQWARLAEEVFDQDGLLSETSDMLKAVMPVALMDHAISFYESDLGRKLVEIENVAHMEDNDEAQGNGEEVLRALLEEQSPRIGIFRAFTDATGSTDVAIRSIVEIQVRYLTAAMAAGASELEMDEEDLRAFLMSQEAEMRENIEVNGLVANAYTYRELSDGELVDYLSALQDPDMKQVYEILNAVQYELMADRYETLATRLSALQPEQEL